MRIKVEAYRVDSKIVHYGIPTVKDNQGQQLYRIACQGRNVRFYTYAADDQTIPVTCQRCKGRSSEIAVVS